MSDSVQPHRRQPTRLLCPWDSPGKKWVGLSGVGCHFLFQCMKVKSEREVAQSRQTLSDPMDCSPQAPPSMGFSRQECWSRVPLPSPLESPKSETFCQVVEVSFIQWEDRGSGGFHCLRKRQSPSPSAFSLFHSHFQRCLMLSVPVYLGDLGGNSFASWLSPLLA